MFSRKKFNSIGVVAQRQWITDKILEFSTSGVNGELVTNYVVGGKGVCRGAFCNTHRFSLVRLS